MHSSSLSVTPQNLPSVIAEYLLTLTIQNRPLAYVKVTPDGHIIQSGGEQSTYGLHKTSVGELISDHLFYLEGFFPYSGQYEVLPSIQTEDGKSIDIHFISPASSIQARETNVTRVLEHLWILLIDSSLETARQQQLQQKSNELNLLRQDYNKLVDQRRQAQPAYRNDEPSATTVTQRMSVLIVQINATARTSTVGSPDFSEPIASLSQCFSKISQIITDAGGFMHHMFGYSAVALFEMSPLSTIEAVSPISPPQAVTAAARLLKPNLLKPFTTKTLADLTLSLGLTIDQAVIARPHKDTHQTINVLGPAISKALELNQQLFINCLTVDEHTLNQLYFDQKTFQIEAAVTERRLEKPKVYRLRLK